MKRYVPIFLLLSFGMLSTSAIAQVPSVDDALEWGQKMAIVQNKLCSAQNDVKCPTTPAYQLIRVDGTQIELDVPWYDWVIPWHADPASYNPKCLTSVAFGTENDCFTGADDQPGSSTLIFGGLPPGDVTVDETTGVGKITVDNKDYFLNSCYAKKPQDLDDPSVSQLATDSVATVQSQSTSLTIDQFRARYFPTYECSLSPDNVVDITKPYAEYASKWVALESIALHTVAFVEETAIIGAAVVASDGALAGLLGDTAWGNGLRTVLNLGLQGYGAEQVVKSIVDDVAALGNCQSQACRIDVTTDLALNSVMAYDTFRTAQKTIAESKASSFADFVGQLTDGSLLFTKDELPEEERKFYRLMSHAAINEDFATLIDDFGTTGRNHVEAFGDLPEEWLNEEWFWEYYDEKLDDAITNNRLTELTEELRRPDEESSGCSRILLHYPDCDGDNAHGADGLWSDNPGEANELFDCADGANPDGGWSTQRHADGDEPSTAASQDDYHFLLGNGVALFAEAEDIPASDISGNHVPVVHQGASWAYSGDGFIDYRGEGYIEWTFDIPVSGDYILTFGYSLAYGSRPLDLIVDGVTQARLPFNATGTSAGAWRTPGTQTYTLDLGAGTKGFRLQTTGSSGPNMDYLAIQAAETVLAPVSSGSEQEVFECPSGMAITRMDVSHGWHPSGLSYEYINGLAFYCGALRADGTVHANIRQDELGYPAWYGNDNGTETVVRCYSNEFVSGLTGRSGGWLDQVGLWCRIRWDSWSDHWVSAPASAGGNGGNTFDSYCPTGQVATGVKLGALGDFYIDHLQLLCNRIQIE